MAQKLFDYSRKLLLYTFFVFGFIYTVFVINSNIVLYFEYQSNFIESPLDDVRGDVYNKVSFSGIKPSS